jgi:predicted PurR-regulated permease PerM
MDALNTNSSKSTATGAALLLSLGLSALLAGALVFAVAIILRPFSIPLLWASVLSVTTWPLFTRLRARMPKRPWLAALILTLALGLILLLVSIPLPLRLADEALELGKRIASMDTTHIAQWGRTIPLIGDLLADKVTNLPNKDGILTTFISANQATLLAFATQAVKGIAHTLAVILMSLVGCFLLYLHGETLVSQSMSIIAKLGISRAPYLFEYVGATVRGAAYSVIATAIAQGTLAGIGYAVAGAPLPFLLAVATMIFSLIPLGAPLLYVPVAGYLIFFADQPWFYGVGLLVWGIACISTVDNLLRSVLISQATHVSPIIVFIGVLGGVLAFGLLGVFVGPALMGVAQSLWLELAQESSILSANAAPETGHSNGN